MTAITRPFSTAVAMSACLSLMWPTSAEASDTVIPLNGPAAGKVTAKIVVREDADQGRVMTCEVKFRQGYRATGYLILDRTFTDSDLSPKGERLDFIHARGRRSIDYRESMVYTPRSGKVICKVRVKVTMKGKSAKARGKAVVALLPPALTPQ